jgi:hypothetical protein
MSDLEQQIGDMLADERITEDDADAVRQFAEFLSVAGPPAKKGEPLEVSPLNRLLHAERFDLIAYAMGIPEDKVPEAVDDIMNARRMARAREVVPMLEMDEIRCQRDDPHEHRTKKAIVELFGQTPYEDYAPIPDDLSDVFFINIWDVESQGDGDGYCPAADAISMNLAQHRIWEPVETITLLRCFREFASNVNSAFVDIGAQLGYYSVLAIRSGVDTFAIEADPDVFDLLNENNGRVGHDVQVAELVRNLDLIVKIDIEGAEREAVEMLGDAFEEGRVKYALIEISPCFRPGYEDLVVDIMEAGYRAFEMPPKQIPPHPLDDIRVDLLPWELRGRPFAVRRTVLGWDQRNVLFVHDSMDWPRTVRK